MTTLSTAQLEYIVAAMDARVEAKCADIHVGDARNAVLHAKRKARIARRASLQAELLAMDAEDAYNDALLGRNFANSIAERFGSGDAQ